MLSIAELQDEYYLLWETLQECENFPFDELEDQNYRYFYEQLNASNIVKLRKRLETVKYQIQLRGVEIEGI